MHSHTDYSLDLAETGTRVSAEKHLDICLKAFSRPQNRRLSSNTSRLQLRREEAVAGASSGGEVTGADLKHSSLLIPFLSA